MTVAGRWPSAYARPRYAPSCEISPSPRRAIQVRVVNPDSGVPARTHQQRQHAAGHGDGAERQRIHLLAHVLGRQQVGGEEHRGTNGHERAGQIAGRAGGVGGVGDHQDRSAGHRQRQADPESPLRAAPEEYPRPDPDKNRRVVAEQRRRRRRRAHHRGVVEREVEAEEDAARERQQERACARPGNPSRSR